MPSFRRPLPALLTGLFPALIGLLGLATLPSAAQTTASPPATTAPALRPATVSTPVTTPATSNSSAVSATPGVAGVNTASPAAPSSVTAPAARPAPSVIVPGPVGEPISINAVAQILAGVTPAPGHPLVDRLVATPEWKEHRDWSQARWAEVNRRLETMRTWRAAELKIPEPQRRTLLYPFSGPDFLNADALFPTHPRLVFFSLERAGSLPDLTKLDGPAFTRMLADVRHALSDIFERNYFITSYMTQQLSKPQIRGTVPIMAVMMALTGTRIVSIESIDPFPELTTQYTTPVAPASAPSATATGATAAPSGQPAQTGAAPGATQPVQAGGSNDATSEGNPAAKSEAKPRTPPRPRLMMSAARITFARPGESNRTLEYYGLDATDKELRWYPKFLETVVGSRQPATVLIKSASYLLHDQQFAGTRSMLLKTGDIIVQDDTGIPLRHLKGAGLDVKLYGVYTAPIKPLTYATQPDLEAAFRAAGQVPNIEFPFGYHGKSGRSMLILARRDK